MIPEEKALVERLSDRPFALIGVNSDPAEMAKTRVKAEGITWRSFADGSTSGPIAKAWSVDHWPSIYVLDAAGKVRYRDIRGAALADAVDRLLQEIESGPK